MQLSDEQTRALTIYASGHPLKVVADRMGITTRSAQTLIAKAKRLNGCSNTAQLIAMAFRWGLLQ